MFAFARRLLLLSLRLAAVGVLLACALGAWALVLEPNRLVVRASIVAPPAWKGHPLRVAVLSDIHVGSPHNGLDRLREIVARTNAEKPDLIVLLGDFDINAIVGGEKIDEPVWTPVLGELEAPLGVFAVLGNHDWWNDPEDIRSHLEKNGIAVLENRSIRVDNGETSFWLAGIGDSVTQHDDVRRALRAVPRGADVLAITHAPDVFRSLDKRVDALLAGHTHGGQVRRPFLGTPAYDEPWVHGAYERGDQRLYVTSGLGMSVYPVRFGVPPEIVLLTIVPGAGAPEAALTDLPTHIPRV